MYESSIQTEFSVDEILNDKIVDGKLLYFVKWKGFSLKQSSWEPEEHLKNAPDQINLWKQKKKKLQKIDKINSRKKVPEEQFVALKSTKKNTKTLHNPKRQTPKRKIIKNLSQLQSNPDDCSTSDNESSKSCNSETTSYRGKGLKRKRAVQNDPIESILESIKKLKQSKSNLAQKKKKDILKVSNQLPTQNPPKTPTKRQISKKKNCQQEQKPMEKERHKKMNASKEFTRTKASKKVGQNLSRKTQKSIPEKFQKIIFEEESKQESKSSIIPSQNQNKEFSNDMFSIRKKDLMSLIQGTDPLPQNLPQIAVQKQQIPEVVGDKKTLQQNLSVVRLQQINPISVKNPQKSLTNKTGQIHKNQFQHKPVIKSFAKISKELMNCSIDDNMFRKITKKKKDYERQKRKIFIEPQNFCTNKSFDIKDNFASPINTSRDVKQRNLIQPKLDEMTLNDKTLRDQLLKQKIQENTKEDVRPAICDEIGKKKQKQMNLRTQESYQDDLRDRPRDYSREYHRNDPRNRYRDNSRDRYRDPQKNIYRDYSRDRYPEDSRDRSRDIHVNKKKHHNKYKSKHKKKSHNDRQTKNRKRSSSQSSQERKHKRRRKKQFSSSSSSSSSRRSLSPQFSSSNDLQSSCLVGQTQKLKPKRTNHEVDPLITSNNRQNYKCLQSNKKALQRNESESKKIKKGLQGGRTEKQLRNNSVVQIASSQNNSSSLAIIDQEQFENRTSKRLALNEDYHPRHKTYYNNNTKYTSQHYDKEKTYDRYDVSIMKEVQNTIPIARSLIDYLKEHPTKWWEKDLQFQIKQIKKAVKEDFTNKKNQQKKNVKKNTSFSSSFNDSEENWNFPFQNNQPSIKLQNNKKKQNVHPKKIIHQSPKINEQLESSTISTQVQKSRQSDTQCFNLLVTDILEWFKDIYPEDQITSDIRKEIEEIVHQMVDKDLGDDLVEKWMENYGKRKLEQKISPQQNNDAAQESSTNSQEYNKKTSSLELDKFKGSYDDCAKSLDYITSFFKPKNKKDPENIIKLQNDPQQPHNQGKKSLINNSSENRTVPKLINHNTSQLVKYEAFGTENLQNPWSLKQDQAKLAYKSYTIQKGPRHQQKPQQNLNLKTKTVVQATNIIKVLSEFEYKGQKCFKILLNNGKQVNAHEADVKNNCPKLLLEYYERKVAAFESEKRRNDNYTRGR